MDEDIMKYLSIDVLPKPIDIENRVEEVKAEIISSLNMPVAKVKLENPEYENLSYISIKDFENRIYLWFIDGWSNKKISDELMNNYGIKNQKTINTLIGKVNKSMRVKYEDDAQILKTRCLEMYNNLYLRALEKKDILTANKILDSIVKLQGLAIHRVETKVENTYKVDFS
jgi:hypothetical protein